MNLREEVSMYLYPIVVLFLYAFILNKILSSDKYEQTRKVDFVICGIKDLFPHKIKKKLKDNKDIDEKLAKEVYKTYKSILLVVASYYILWIIYVILIVKNILNLATTYQSLSIDEISKIFAFRFVDFMILYWFCLTPIFEKIPKLKKLAQAGYETFNFFQNICDTFSQIINKLVERVVPFLFSLILFVCYLEVVKRFFFYTNGEIGFWTILITLLVYQHVILKIMCNIMIECKIIKQYLIKKQVLDIHHKSILYLIIKNETYLGMVAIYAFAVDANQSSLAIPAALGVVFLIDTYFAQNENIQKMIDENTDKNI